MEDKIGDMESSTPGRVERKRDNRTEGPIPQIVIDRTQRGTIDRPKKTKKVQASNSEIMVKASDENNRKTDEQTADISNSKDKAQVTANTALFLTNIALLKKLIEEGPGGYKYFMLNMVLVTLSLFFQIVIGVSSLVMHQLQGEANKLKKGKSSTTGGRKTRTLGNENKGFHVIEKPVQIHKQVGDGQQDTSTEVSVIDENKRHHTDDLDTADQQENKGLDIVSPPEKSFVSLRGILGSRNEESLHDYYNQLCDEIFHPENSDDEEDEEDPKARAKLNRKKELLHVLDSQIRAWQKRNFLTKISNLCHLYLKHFHNWIWHSINSLLGPRNSVHDKAYVSRIHNSPFTKKHIHISKRLPLTFYDHFRGLLILKEKS